MHVRQVTADAGNYFQPLSLRSCRLQRAERFHRGVLLAARSPEALAIDPSDADALANSAYTYFFLDYFCEWRTTATNYDAKVLGQVDRAIALAPDNLWAYFVKSNYLNSTRQPNQGLGAADEGLAVNPNYAPLYVVRAYAEIGLGRFDHSKSDIVQAMRLVRATRQWACGGWF